MADTGADAPRSWRIANGKKPPARRAEEANQMTECHAESTPGMIDLTSTSFQDLMDLDASLVEAAVDRLMPRCGGMSSRFWNQNECFSPVKADREIRV
jgi:hypothetical protein